MTAAGADERVFVRAHLAPDGRVNVDSGLPVLDHLLTLLARYASLDLALEVAPGEAGSGLATAAHALGRELAGQLRAEGARGYGSAALPSSEALAHVALEVSDRPLVVSNVDLSDARIGGLANDLVAEFLHEFARGAGLTLHVRLITGEDEHHVPEAIFKALGVALSQAAHPRPGRE
jgi:imidazoleglycerol-phosphate dehydratase